MNWAIKISSAAQQLAVSLIDFLNFSGISPTVSTTLASSAAVDDSTIDVDDATGILVGGIITIGSQWSKVVSISSNTLTISPTIVEAVAASSAVTYSSDHADALRALRASIGQVEMYLNRALITQTVQLQLDHFPNKSAGFALLSGRDTNTPITLLRPPLASFTKLEYYDQDNVLQTFLSSKYYLDTHSEPARLFLSYSQSWPTNVRANAAVLAEYVCGYGDNSNSVPFDIQEGIMLQAKSNLDADSQDVKSEKIGGISFTYADKTDAGSIGLNDSAKTLLRSYRILYV